MNERKRHVLNIAHQLFIEKGFRSTSIQDILEHSEIAKGTFYNYFSSKNELLKEIFKTTYKKMENERKELLVGNEPSDPEVFIKQIELQMRTNRENNLIPLYEEVLFSNDQDLRLFLQNGQLKTLQWIKDRLADLFDDRMQPYLLDGAIMLIGILQQNTRYFTMAYGDRAALKEVVRYSVARITALLEDAANSGQQLFKPDLLDEWFPQKNSEDNLLRKRICTEISNLKSVCEGRFDEQFDFIQEELFHTQSPRMTLIDSVVFALSQEKKLELDGLRSLIKDYFQAENE